MRAGSAGGAGTTGKHTASIRYPEEDTDNEDNDPDNDPQDANGYIVPKSPTSAQAATTPAEGEGTVNAEERVEVSHGGVLGNGAVKGGL